MANQSESGPKGVLTLTSYAAFFLFVLLADTMVFWSVWPRLPAGLITLVCLTGVALVLANDRAAWRLLFRPPVLFFTLFVLLGLALCPFSVNRFRALYYVGGYGGLLLFAVAMARRNSFGQLLDLLRVALGLGIVVSVVTHVSGNYNGFTMHNDEITDRFAGWYMNPNPMAMVCALFLLLTLVDLVHLPAQKRHRHLLLTLPVAALAAMILLCAQSRTVWFALTGALGMFFLVRVMKTKGLPIRQRVPRWLWPLVVLVPLATLVTVHDRLRMESSFLSMNGRSLCWDFAVEKIEQRPWSGYGLGSVYDVLADYPDPMLRCGVHNTYIEAALYTGVAGGILFLLFMAGMAARAMVLYWRDDRHDALSLLSVFFLILALPSPIILGRPMSATLLVLVLAAVASLPTVSTPKPEV